MEIAELKARLNIVNVLAHYGLRPDKSGRVHCPFHLDQTPSMQVYQATGTVYCFSSNCRLHGKAIDGIDFILHKENISKHQAIQKAQTLLKAMPTLTKATPENSISPEVKTPNADKSPATDKGEALSRSAVLGKAFGAFQAALRNSEVARSYLIHRCLSEPVKQGKIEVGYNSGGMHQYHKHLTESFAACGILYKNELSRGYSTFAKHSLAFPLRDVENHIVGLYFRSLPVGQSAGEDKAEAKHFYLRDRAGLYPAYPKADAKTLVLTESVIDAATLYNYPSVLGEQTAVLALYGTNGWTAEHDKAVSNLAALQEVVIFFDGDAAGHAAVGKYSKQLMGTYPGLKISHIQTPEGEDINSLAQSYEQAIFQNLFENRIYLSSQNGLVSYPLFGQEDSSEADSDPEPDEDQAKPAVTKLQVLSNELLVYDNCELNISVLGGIKLTGLDRMRVTLKIVHKRKSTLPLRHNLDLYHSGQTGGLVSKICEQMETNQTQTMKTIEALITELENYRAKRLEAMQPKKQQTRRLTDRERQQAMNFLQDPGLLEKTNEMIAQSGLVGEDVNRMIAFLIYTSRKRENPLHLLCLGASGSGKTYLQEKVSALVPEEDKIEITTLSENAFYYFGQEELRHKLLLIEDLDGAADVLYPLRELQSKRRITKTVTLKDTKGNLKTVTLRVEGPVCVSGCTTKEKLYEDNANRCILIDIDSSKTQDEKIIAYQRQLSAGTINRSSENQAVLLLQNCQKLLKSIAVRNPYAPLISLPETVFKPRRTIGLLLSFIETITFYHQHQLPVRKDPLTGENYIQTTPEHIKQAFGLLTEVLFRKSDELTFACRSFFERLKTHLEKENKESFYAKPIRSAFRIAPATLSRYLFELERYGLLKSKGNKYKGYEYTLTNTDEYRSLKALIDSHLQVILDKIAVP